MRCERCHRRKPAHQWFDQDGRELYICNKCWDEVPHEKVDPKDDDPGKVNNEDDFEKSLLSSSSLETWKGSDDEDSSTKSSSLNMSIKKFLKNIAKKRDGKKTLAAHYAAVVMAKRKQLGYCKGIGVSMGNEKGHELHSGVFFDLDSNSIYWKAHMGPNGKWDSWWEMHLSILPDGTDMDGTVLYCGKKGGFQSWTLATIPLEFYDMVNLVSGFLVKHGESLDDML